MDFNRYCQLPLLSIGTLIMWNLYIGRKWQFNLHFIAKCTCGPFFSPFFVLCVYRLRGWRFTLGFVSIWYRPVSIRSCHSFVCTFKCLYCSFHVNFAHKHTFTSLLKPYLITIDIQTIHIIYLNWLELDWIESDRVCACSCNNAMRNKIKYEIKMCRMPTHPST